MRALAETIVSVTGSRSRVVLREDDADAPAFHLSSRKAASELGWSARYDLVNGLIGTIESRLFAHA